MYASSLRAYNTHMIIYDVCNKVWEVRPNIVKTSLKIYTYLHIIYYYINSYSYIYIYRSRRTYTTREHNNASLYATTGGAVARLRSSVCSHTYIYEHDVYTHGPKCVLCKRPLGTKYIYILYVFMYVRTKC